MPRNHRRYRLSYLPERRRELLTKTSNTRYAEPGGLFEMPREENDDVARFSDVLDAVGNTDEATLFVPYYSSTPFNVGAIYWAPARLRGAHLEFTDPERLIFTKAPATEPVKQQSARRAGGFAEGARPRTQAKLRPRPEEQEGKS